MDSTYDYVRIVEKIQLFYEAAKIGLLRFVKMTFLLHLCFDFKQFTGVEIHSNESSQLSYHLTLNHNLRVFKKINLIKYHPREMNGC